MKSTLARALVAAAVLVPFGSASGQVAGAPVAPQPSVPVAAQGVGSPSSSRAYLAARVGAYVPQSDDLKDWKFGTGMDFEVGVGMQFTPVLGAEFGIGRFASSGEATMTYPEDGGTTFEHFDGDLSVMSFTASLRASAPLQGSVSLYGLVGLGVYSADVSGKGGWEWTHSYYATESETYSIDESDSPFGFHLGAGIGFAVAPKVRLGLEVKYAMVEAEFGDQKFDLGGFRLGGGLVYQF